MSGYLGTKAVFLSTTTANVGGDSTVGGDLTVDTNTLYVDSTNNRVGIGTSSPKTELNIAANNSGQGAKLTIENSDTSITTGDILGQIDFYANDGSTNGTGAKANIRSVVESSAGTLIGLAFGTSNSASATAVEAMRIDSSGNLLVGSTAQTYSSRLEVSHSGLDGITTVFNGTAGNNAMKFHNANGQVGAIVTSGTSTSYNTSSDYRLKENVVPLAGAADRLAQIPVHRFNFIADPDTTVDGFLAHEVQAVVPEAVTGTHNEVDDDGNAVMQGIDQSKLVPLLTAALKEAITKIEILETEMTSVKARLDALEGN